MKIDNNILNDVSNDSSDNNLDIEEIKQVCSKLYQDSNIHLIEKDEIAKLLKPLNKFAHKGTQGHALIIGGSFGKIGAACLASKAALTSGCGLVTAFLPKCGVPVIQSYFPEAMAIADIEEKIISDIHFDIKPDAIGIGIGMGKQTKTEKALHDFLKGNFQRNIPLVKEIPLVLDADALNILAHNQDWLTLLPKQSILTPHPGELKRLIGRWKNNFEKIERTVKFARKYDLIVLIKGHNTLIITPNNIFINSSGTAALATAGSGDVLTGIITGLLAQGYSPIDSARIGAYLHGYTADITYKSIHPKTFIASDIINNLSDAYFSIEKEN